MIPQRSNAKSLDRWWCRCDDSHGIENRRQPRPLELFFFFPPWPRRENSEKVRGHDNKQPAVPSSIRFSEFLLSWNVLSRLISSEFFFVSLCWEKSKRGINNTSFYIILRRIFKNRQTMERLDRNVEELVCGVNREIHG